MEEDEELMTIEISALLCSIISQGTKNDEKYRIRRQLRRCPARRGGRSATCACRVSSRIFRNVLLYSSRGALTPTGQLEDNAEDNRIRVRNDAHPINNPMPGYGTSLYENAALSRVQVQVTTRTHPPMRCLKCESVPKH